MAFFNILMIYFYILQPSTHNSYISDFSSVFDSPLSMGMYAKGQTGYEFNAGVSISAGYNGYVMLIGAPSISLVYRKDYNIFKGTVLAVGENSALSAGYGRIMKIGNRDILGELSANMYRFYELEDLYAFFSADARCIMPFSWGKYVKPFIGLEMTAGVMDFPDNIREALPGADMLFIHGINAQYKFLNFAYYSKASINCLNWGISISAVF